MPSRAYHVPSLHASMRVPLCHSPGESGTGVLLVLPSHSLSHSFLWEGHKPIFLWRLGKVLYPLGHWVRTDKQAGYLLALPVMGHYTAGNALLAGNFLGMIAENPASLQRGPRLDLGVVCKNTHFDFRSKLCSPALFIKDPQFEGFGTGPPH